MWIELVGRVVVGVWVVDGSVVVVGSVYVVVDPDGMCGLGEVVEICRYVERMV